MKRLMITTLIIAVMLSGCAAGRTGSTETSDNSSTASTTEMTQHTSESLGIRFECDSTWVVDENPSEPELNLTWGDPDVNLELYVVEGYLDTEYYTEEVVKRWLKEAINYHYESPDTGEIFDSAIQDITSFRSGYNQYELDCISIQDTYITQTQSTNGDTSSYSIREMWGWIQLPDDAVLVLHYREPIEPGFPNDCFKQLTQLINSINYYGKPVSRYDSYGELVGSYFYDAETAARAKRW